jgi:sterol desaturase/sphingolipid hydroxylase (fatty acid hydroxylase superfamily)
MDMSSRPPSVSVIQPLLVASIFLVLAMSRLEHMIPARTERGDTERNLMIWAFNAILGALLISSATAVVVSLPALRRLPHLDLRALPLWIAALIYVVVADLADYLAHRLQHAVPWFWRLHAVHHSDPCMNVTTTNRHHWGAMLLMVLVSVPTTAIFLRPQPIHLAIYSIANLWVTVCHSNIDLHLGPLNRVFNSPNLHRSHHSREPKYFDRNFANIFSVWDVLLGAYVEPPPTPPQTGLDTAPRTIGEALIWPFMRMSAPD